MPNPEITFKPEHSTEVLELLNKLKKDVFGSKNIDALADDASPERIAFEWMQYLGGALIESETIRQGKKARTAKRRYNSILKLRKAFGDFPSAKDVDELFTRYQVAAPEVVEIVQNDVKAFQKSDLYAKDEFRILMQETNQLLKDLKAKNGGK